MTSLVTDLEDVLKNWALSVYKQTKAGKKSYVEVDVNWDKVHIQYGQPNFFKMPRQSPQSQVLMRSTFDNDMRQFQHHTFRTTRKTMATVTTKLSKGFTRGVNTGIQLPVPNQVLKAKFGNYVTINTDDEKTVEHAMSWSIDTNVKAPPGRRTIAELQILEQQLVYNFKMKVTFRGTVVVNLFDRVSGRRLVVQNDIATVIRDRLNVKDNGSPSAFWPVQGTVKFRYGVDQNVHVYQRPLAKGQYRYR